MKNAIKNVLSSFLIMGLLCLGAFMAPADAHAKGPVKKGIPVTGKTQDGKYEVYDLQGDLNDINYFSNGGSTVWTSGDLIGRMKYADAADVKAGRIKCDWICKDGSQRVVGLNPANKNLFK